MYARSCTPSYLVCMTKRLKKKDSSFLAELMLA